MPIFRFLEEHGQIGHREMFNIFNMGIGMVLILQEKDAPKAQEILKSFGRKSWVIGEVTDKEGVIIEP